MGKKRIIVTIVLLFLVANVPAYAQSFEDWKKQQQEEFQAYKDKFDEEFIKMLKTTWEEVGINAGSKNYDEDKPDDIPAFVPPPPRPNVEADRPEDTVIEEDLPANLDIDLDTKPVVIPKPKPIKKAEKSALFTGNLQINPLTLTYFSTPVPLAYPNRVKANLNVQDYRNSEIDNERVAEFWAEVSSIDHTAFVTHTLEIKESFGLNDWGYILLVNSISKSIFGERETNLVRLMNWFLLTKAGYQNKVGYDKQGVYNLFTVTNNIFNTKYYTLDGNKFFPINFNEEYQTPTSIFTYQGNHEAQVRKLDLSIASYPVFVAPENQLRRTLEFEFQGKPYKVPVTVNRDMVSYFEYYPLTDLQVFFTASFSPQAKKELSEALIPVVKTMNEVQAVNFLLRMVQTAFDYQTDQDQFDREKYMLPDEALFYRYSDCDDRSILFATLVRDLLGLDVVGLRYSRHLAVAVNFRGNVNGDYHMSDGKKYVVADPTYINAPVGLTMSNYRDEKPAIVKF